MSWSKPKRLLALGPEPNLGPGTSRPLPKERTRMYRLSVELVGAPPMRVTLLAASRHKALLYCRNRWPDCVAEVIK